MRQSQQQSAELKVRLDKWLWAARFYKTRQRASAAVSSGMVRYNGQRSKSSKQVQCGANITINQRYYQQQIVVEALSEHRGSATDAACLYTETAESISTRQQAIQQYRALRQSQPDYGKRPDKKSRRLIHRFKSQVKNHE